MNAEKSTGGETFRYTYTAPDGEERKYVENIRRQYAFHTEDGKVEELKRLDDKVKRAPRAISLSLGIFGCLLFGLGMALTLEYGLVAAGIVASAVGLIPIAAAYPLHGALLKRRKERYAERIFKLSEEILNEGRERP